MIRRERNLDIFDWAARAIERPAILDTLPRAKRERVLALLLRIGLQARDEWTAKWDSALRSIAADLATEQRRAPTKRKRR